MKTAPIGLAIVLALSGSDRAAGCVGDCNGDGLVSINELIVGVNIALGVAPVTSCASFDIDGDGQVSVNELVSAVAGALNGCAAPVPTPTPTPVPTSDRLTDNGDGTITDQTTKLVWEKKVGLGGGMDATNPHAADNLFTWAGDCSFATGTLCQPTAAAAAACSHNAEGDQVGCSVCAPSDGFCIVDPHDWGATTTVWDWLAQLNSGSGFATKQDWRIPTIKELETTYDYESAEPILNSGGCGGGCTDIKNPDCSCTANGDSGYFSATAALVDPLCPDASARTFADGYSTSDYKDSGDAVRAVRGGRPTPDPRYVDNRDGTITDKSTGLMWEKKVGLGPTRDPDNLSDVDNEYQLSGRCLNTNRRCQPTSAASLLCMSNSPPASGCAACSNTDGPCVSMAFIPGSDAETIWTWILALNGARLAGYADWRIPTITELESLTDYTTNAPPTADRAFVGTSCGPLCLDLTSPACSCTGWDPTTPIPYISSSGFTFNGVSTAWTVDFSSGYVQPDFYEPPYGLVRAVRGGGSH